MSAPVRNRRGLDLWQAQNLKLIAFPTEPQLKVDQNWWRDLTGSQPEVSTRRIADRSDQGPYRNLTLNLTVDLLRIQLTLFPRITEQAPSSGLFTVGALPEV